jgi:hypothetical protein
MLLYVNEKLDIQQDKRGEAGKWGRSEAGQLGKGKRATLNDL